MKTVLVLCLCLAAASAVKIACERATGPKCPVIDIRFDEAKDQLLCCPEFTYGATATQGDDGSIESCTCYVKPPPDAGPGGKGGFYVHGPDGYPISVPYGSGYPLANNFGGGSPGGSIEIQALEKYRELGLKRHNELRAKHGAGPLVEDDLLNDMAQRYAEYLADGKKDMKPSEFTTKWQLVGENLAVQCSSSGTDYKGPEAADSWYSEIKDYNYTLPGFTYGTGHFTQLVWKASTKVGQGKARSEDGKCVYGVAIYYVPGNVEGKENYIENVGPLVQSDD